MEIKGKGMQVGMDTPDIQRAKKAYEIASQVSAECSTSVTFTIKYNGPLKMCFDKIPLKVESIENNKNWILQRHSQVSEI